MDFIRVYRGKVNSLRQLGVTADGIRSYEVYFRDGKKCYYECHQKKTLPIAVGEMIRFTGHWVPGPIPFFYIDEVVDSSYIERLESQHYYERVTS